MARRPNQLYTPLRPDADGNPVGGGYKCSACGLEGLAFGEPHYRSSGTICEPHPDGQEIITYAPASAGGLAVRHQGGAPIEGTIATPLHPDLLNDLARMSPADRNALHQDVRSRLADNTVATAAAKGEVDGAGQKLDASFSAEQLAQPSVTPTPADGQRTDTPLTSEPTAPYGDNGMGEGGGGVIQPHEPYTGQIGGEATDRSLPGAYDTVPVTAAPGEPPGGPVASYGSQQHEGV